MAKTTKGRDSAQVGRLRTALARERAKSAALAKSRAEALEQQAAAAEILKVISRSPSNAQPVFDAIVKRAVRLLGGHSALMTRVADGVLHLAALTSTSRSGDAAVKSGYPRSVSKETSHGQALLKKTPIVTRDTEQVSRTRPRAREIGRARGYRSFVVVPMLLEGAGIGTIAVTRKERGPFSKHQIDLLKTFADQAVIAIENVRRFNETKEALERQTATAEILKVIAGSPTDAQPVFEVIVQSAVRLCGARFGRVYRYDGSAIEMVAGHGLSARGVAQVRKVFPRPVSDDTIVGRVIQSKRPFFIQDIERDDSVPELSRQMIAALDTRSQVTIPMLRGTEPIGAITMGWDAPDAFTDQQVALLKIFADQAVIAIENVRLFNETKESLEQQTAISEILRVMSDSPSDVAPVLAAVAERSMRICESTEARIFLLENDQLRYAAGRGDVEWGVGLTRPITRGLVIGRAVIDRAPVHVEDLATVAETEYPLGRELQRRFGHRTTLAVPLLREGKALGAILLRRTEVRPFTEKQISLLKTFADQAAIAIENVRLFNETKESLERQTATAEILRVIGSSPTDTQPVFEAIVQSGLKLFPESTVGVTRPDGDQVHMVAIANRDPAVAAATKTRFPVRLTREYLHSTAILEARVVDLPDAELAKNGPFARGIANFLATGNRAMTVMPMLRGDKAIGAISVTRPAPGPLTEKQLSLLRIFADQAVIAIENVRLFNETKESLERQTATAEILKVIASSPSDVQPVLEAVAASAARLCEASNAVIFRLDGGLLRQVAAYGGIPTSSHPPAGLPLDRGRVTGRAVVDRRTIHVHDLAAETSEYPAGSRDAQHDGHRTTLATPLLREGAPIGAILIRRMEVQPFSDKQIFLLQTFADQAVIAIENVRLFNETKESLERQTATAEILKVIASSPSDVQPVFDAIAASARRLLGGHAANVARRAGDVLELAAFTSTGEAGDSEINRLWPAKITGKGHMGKALLSKAPAWVEDIETDPSYSEEFRAGARARGMRSAVSVPMLREGEAIGVISVNRSIPGRFSDHQTNLLKTFADQALIAIENVRLFNETREALARQEAAAQVLRSISESVSDTAPVFTAILDCCNRLIPSIDYVQVQLIEGSDRVRLVDHRFGQVRGAAPGKQDERRAELMAREAKHFPRPLAGSTLERALNQGRVVILADTLDGPDTPPGTLVEARRWGHSYSQITVPLMREGRCIGAIEAFRRQLGGFEAKESSLLESFADQAVIAIENVRLFNETKEALERQTATAEILKVISGSPTDTQPVFDAIVNSCARLFDGLYVVLNIVFGNTFDRVAVSDPDRARQGAELFPMPLDSSSVAGRAMLRNELIQIEDLAAEEWIREGTRSFFARSGFGSALCAPMSRDGQAIGSIMVFRASTGRFKEEQVALLRTFSDQAVIAIENVRLFNELQSRTEALGKSVEKLTALGEVGQAISSTLDLETVLTTIASRAVQLTRLDGASIYEYDEAAAEFRLQVAHNFDPEFLQAIRNAPIRKGDGTVGGVAITLEPAQVTDILEGSYHSSRKDLLTRAGYRAVLTVPLLREARIIGALSVTRKTPGPFAPEIVELLKTFATQSAMAIQNARLFREIAEKGKQLEEASKHKSQFLASMSHELRTPLNAILGFNEMILGDIYGEVPADMKEPLTDIQTSGKHLLRLINNVLDLAKIEAGRMELALDDYSVHDTVESVRSTLRPLAEAKGLELAVDVPPDIPLARGDGGRITQCLMNLAGNSLKFTRQGRVGISVVLSNATLTYQVKDTGIGIPPDKIGSLFTEFKQTDATIASEYGGTGLGLSITKKFIEMHGGRIWAESEPGSGSTFIFEIPLRAGEAGEP